MIDAAIVNMAVSEKVIRRRILVGSHSCGCCSSFVRVVSLGARPDRLCVPGAWDPLILAYAESGGNLRDADRGGREENTHLHESALIGGKARERMSGLDRRCGPWDRHRVDVHRTSGCGPAGLG